MNRQLRKAPGAEHLRKSLGYEVRTIIRTESEVLTEPLDAEAQQSLMALTTEIDDFHVRECEV